MQFLYLLCLVLCFYFVELLTILDLVSSSTIVSTQSNVSVSVLSSGPSVLKLQLSSLFSPLTNCTADGVGVDCTLTQSNGQSVLSFGSREAGTHRLVMTVKNPSFVDSFPLLAYQNNTLALNQAVIALTPQPITCTATPSSLLVGDLALATIILTNSPLPPGASLQLSVPQMPPFANFFLDSPSCTTFPNITLLCSLSTIFSTQVLTIGSLPTAANLRLTISSIHNPPFNATLFTPSLSILNAEGKVMQTCTVNVSAPSTLQSTRSLSLIGWNTTVGATSTPQVVLRPYFTHFCVTTFVKLLYSNDLFLQGDAPFNSSLRLYTATNPTVNNTHITFRPTLTNPSVVQPLLLTSFLVCNSTLYVEQGTSPNLALTPSTNIPLFYTQTDNRTLQLSLYTFTVQLPSSLSSLTIEIGLQFGVIQCSASLLLHTSTVQNAAFTLLSCTQNRVSLFSAAELAGSVRVVLTVRNPLSVNANAAYFLVQGVLNASATVSYGPNNQTMTITNNNPSFNSNTSLTLREPALNATYTRVLVVRLPSDLQLGDIGVSCAGCTVLATVVQGSALNITVTTPPAATTLTILRIINPLKYQFSRAFAIHAYDTAGALSSLSVGLITPEYTPSAPALQFAFLNTTIDATTNLSLTIIPSLLYISPPSVSLRLPAAIIIAPCSQCTATSADSLTLPFAPFLKLTIQLQNSGEISNNSIQVTIHSGALIFEQTTVAYSLLPIALIYSASFTGTYGDSGTIVIAVDNAPTKSRQLVHSGEEAALSSVQCVGCNNTYLQLEGVVKLVQFFTVRVQYVADRVVYAAAEVRLQYPCAALSGCRLCAQSSCTKCFDSSLSAFNLLYNGNCLRSCPPSTYSNNATCLACPALCFRCSAVGCLECVSSFVVFAGACVDKCPAEYETIASVCVARPPFCPSCTLCVSDGNCSLCAVGYSILASACYGECPTPYYSEGGVCTPIPALASFYPFAFCATWLLLLLTLFVLRLQDRRVLLLQNILAFGGVLEVGVVVFLLLQTPFLLTASVLPQIMLLVLLLSKLLLSLFFLVYFCKVIAQEPEFAAWKQEHITSYRILLLLSGVLSIQLMRVAYSHLLPLSGFYAKFSSARVVRAMRNVSLLHALSFMGPVWYLAVSALLSQKGFPTLVFLVSLETCALELAQGGCLLLAHCLSPDLSFQSHRVANASDHAHLHPATLNLHEEAASSEQIIFPRPTRTFLSDTPTEEAIFPRPAHTSLWRKSHANHASAHTFLSHQPHDPTQQAVPESADLPPNEQIETSGPLQSEATPRAPPLRPKIIDQWRLLQKQLPNPWSMLHTNEHLHSQRHPSLLSKSLPKIQEQPSSPPRTNSLPKSELKPFTSRPSYDHLNLVSKPFYQIRRQEPVAPTRSPFPNQTAKEKKNIFQTVEEEKGNTDSHHKLENNVLQTNEEEKSNYQNHFKVTEVTSSIKEYKIQDKQQQSAKGQIKQQIGELLDEIDKQRDINKLIQKQSKERTKEQKVIKQPAEHQQLSFDSQKDQKQAYKNSLDSDQNMMIKKSENQANQQINSLFDNNGSCEQKKGEQNEGLKSKCEIEKRKEKDISWEMKQVFRKSSRHILSKETSFRYQDDSYEGFDIRVEKVKQSKADRKTESVYLQRLSLPKPKPRRHHF